MPSMVGRSPSYMFRQLYDFGHAHRTGEWSPLMAQVVSNLDQDDMLAIVAPTSLHSILDAAAAPPQQHNEKLRRKRSLVACKSAKPVRRT